jgi:hypothetical protein
MIFLNLEIISIFIFLYNIFKIFLEFSDVPIDDYPKEIEG